MIHILGRLRLSQAVKANLGKEASLKKFATLLLNRSETSLKSQISHKNQLPIFKRGYTSDVSARIGPRQNNGTATGRTWSWGKRLAYAAVLSPSVGAAIWIFGSNEPERRIKLIWTVPLRLGRDILTAATIVADYQYSLRGLPLISVSRQEAKRECHLRGADRLQALLFKNGGIYIKLGQHIAQLDYLLPDEYVKTMKKVMLDKCPTSTPSQVESLFQKELGKSPNELFAEYDPEPIASASLAQVHTARLHSGQKVAVKVQHAHLTDTAVADTLTVKYIVNVLYWLYPNFDYRWLIAEMESSLPKELDFVHEASNARQCASNFSVQSPQLRNRVSVPIVYPDLSTRRILTMEFMDGANVTDTQAITNMGLRPADVAKLVSEAFAEMIFHHGFVHCDPHAANIKVRVAPSSSLLGGRKRPQLVLLDHGLYRTLSPSIRFNYASLWKALVFADVDAIQKYSAALGAGDGLYMLFAGVLTMRPWERVSEASLGHLQIPDTQEGRAEIQANAALYVNEISELLRRLPRVVLLLLKTNDCLRSVDIALGAPINTIVVIGRQCTRALAAMKKEDNNGFRNWMLFNWQLWHAELRILALQTLAWLAHINHHWKVKLGRMLVSGGEESQLI